MGIEFNEIKDIVVNVMWVLGLLGISLEVAPIKIHPLSFIVSLIVKPFKEMVSGEL